MCNHRYASMCTPCLQTFPSNYTEAVRQAQTAAVQAIEDGHKLIEVEFPTSSLQGVSGKCWPAECSACIPIIPMASAQCHLLTGMTVRLAARWSQTICEHVHTCTQLRTQMPVMLVSCCIRSCCTGAVQSCGAVQQHEMSLVPHASATLHQTLL